MCFFSSCFRSTASFGPSASRTGLAGVRCCTIIPGNPCVGPGSLGGVRLCCRKRVLISGLASASSSDISMISCGNGGAGSGVSAAGSLLILSLLGSLRLALRLVGLVVPTATQAFAGACGFCTPCGGIYPKLAWLRLSREPRGRVRMLYVSPRALQPSSSRFEPSSSPSLSPRHLALWHCPSAQLLPARFSKGSTWSPFA